MSSFCSIVVRQVADLVMGNVALTSRLPSVSPPDPEHSDLSHRWHSYLINVGRFAKGLQTSD